MSIISISIFCICLFQVHQKTPFDSKIIFYWMQHTKLCTPHWEKRESQNGSPRRAVWSSVTQLSITLQESHFGSLFFLGAMKKVMLLKSLLINAQCQSILINIIRKYWLKRATILSGQVELKGFPALSLLMLSHNALVEFPDLSDVSSHLKIVNTDDNKIKGSVMAKHFLGNCF